MEQLLIVRETCVRFYKKYETFIILVVKFLAGVYIFQKIHTIGFVNPALAAFNDIALPFSFLMGVAFTFLPVSLSFFLLIVAVTLQYSAIPEVAVVVFLFLICVLVFYVRMAPKEAYLILAVVAAFHFKLPYLVPLLAGLYGSPTTIVPISIGVFVSTFFPVIQGLAATTKTVGLELTEMPAAYTDLYTALVTNLTNTHSWLVTAFVFAMVVVIVYVVARLAIDFSKEIAIALGCALNIFGCMMAVLIMDESISLPGMIFSTIFCGLLAEGVRFFDAVLDYQRAESVQFEDETNYYYVRVVPKVQLTKRKRVVRRIKPQPEDDD